MSREHMACSRAEIIGVANKNDVFVMLMGLTECIMKPVFNNFDGYAVLTSCSDA